MWLLVGLLFQPSHFSGGKMWAQKRTVTCPGPRVSSRTENALVLPGLLAPRYLWVACRTDHHWALDKDSHSEEEEKHRKLSACFKAQRSPSAGLEAPPTNTTPSSFLSFLNKESSCTPPQLKVAPTPGRWSC